jgi:hypothetical protein
MILAEKEKIDESQGRTLLSDASGKSAFRLHALAEEAPSRPNSSMHDVDDELDPESDDEVTS